MMSATDARTLAGVLAELDDTSWVRLLSEHKISPTVAWEDYFDAADALLAPPAVARALTALTSDEAHALTEAALTHLAIDDLLTRSLIARGILTPDGAPYDTVRDALEAAALSSANIATEEPADAAGAAIGGDPGEQAAERAFTAAGSLADVLHATTEAPLVRIGSGNLGANDRRRLFDAGAVADPADADILIEIAALAGLVLAGDREWLITRAGIDWLETGSVARWNLVAQHVRDNLPEAVRTADGGWTDPTDWAGAYPYDPLWPAASHNLLTLMQRWAMIGPDGVPPVWAAGLSTGGNVDEAALQALLPQEVDRLYLQNDLTAIAPGPLSPPLDLRLRSMASRESRAQASTYRFTAETISAAFAVGETAESIRTFLLSLSLTGVPQPLAYEIDRAAARHGRLRVGPDETGRTRVVSDDAALLQMVGVDQALRPLGLVPDGEGLVTRSSPDTAFWLIADARYPVVAIDANGAARALDRRRIAEPADTDAHTHEYSDIVARLRSAHETDSDGAWLDRELDRAVRTRAIVIVAVRLPDGSQRELTLEATGMGGGRLRGRDRGADVERTLPVSSIVSVRPA